jgi:hypothetical protein
MGLAQFKPIPVVGEHDARFLNDSLDTYSESWVKLHAELMNKSLQQIKQMKATEIKWGGKFCFVPSNNIQQSKWYSIITGGGTVSLKEIVSPFIDYSLLDEVETIVYHNCINNSSVPFKYLKKIKKIIDYTGMNWDFTDVPDTLTHFTSFHGKINNYKKNNIKVLRLFNCRFNKFVCPYDEVKIIVEISNPCPKTISDDVLYKIAYYFFYSNKAKGHLYLWSSELRNRLNVSYRKVCFKFLNDFYNSDEKNWFQKLDVALFNFLLTFF